MRLIMHLLCDNSAAVAIEYGLFAALFAVGTVAMLQLVGLLQAQ
jgi:Flp pilus assembly pilin Flp